MDFYMSVVNFTLTHLNTSFHSHLNMWVIVRPEGKGFPLRLKGDIDIKGILNKETITSIIECIRNSDDITNYQLSLLG